LAHLQHHRGFGQSILCLHVSFPEKILQIFLLHFSLVVNLQQQLHHRTHPARTEVPPAEQNNRRSEHR
jgi:hypothetical protein